MSIFSEYEYSIPAFFREKKREKNEKLTDEELPTSNHTDGINYEHNYAQREVQYIYIYTVATVPDPKS